MNATRIIGLVILAIGIVLVVLGINAANALGEQVREGVTGRFSDRTTWYIILGVAAIVGGAALAFFGGRGRRISHA